MPLSVRAIWISGTDILNYATQPKNREISFDRSVIENCLIMGLLEKALLATLGHVRIKFAGANELR